jgi:glycosyltransferase involved in cell wall biosynthesis
LRIGPVTSDLAAVFPRANLGRVYLDTVKRKNMISVVSSSNPEVDRLAGELCRRGVLDSFVRRYVNKGRWWEKCLAALPGIRSRFASTIGRRPLAPGLSADKVTDAGIIYDFLSALFVRSGSKLLRTGGYVQMVKRRNTAIASKGVECAADARIVVANYGVGAKVFENVKRRGGQTILNYPNAHHRYSCKLIEEEMEREPEFASTFGSGTFVYAATYDRECELADTILVGSSFVRHSFIEEGLGTKNIVVVPYGIDASGFRPSQTAKADNIFRALFVGQVTQRKGISYLLRAYQAFQGSGTELMIVGRWMGDPAAFARYHSLFTYLGNLSHLQLASVYQRADVFVFPTLLEGMGLVVLEAMASGLPVITTSHGPGDIVRDGVDGFIVPIRDSDAIVDRLEYLRAHPEVRAEMGRAARARALEFTWKSYCEKAADVVLGVAASACQANEYHTV